MITTAITTATATTTTTTSRITTITTIMKLWNLIFNNDYSVVYSTDSTC